ncbi:small subunit ribosomal protein S20 [Lihuaxuella thermophila]|uniref:Small ribosomal subunit protein bS20 n=1 Tax=Lihuaxuella thermophila TaxID=1173111 RepID=A0A1H8D916_9BACL|nr:small subunit ribosomal protein S20 [Lihuaxuella thermophila]
MPREVKDLANIKSAIKRAKTNEVRRARNAAQKSAMRTTVKKFLAAVEANDQAQATALLKEATRSLDKAVTKGIIHKNAAARKKSRLAKKLQALNA